MSSCPLPPFILCFKFRLYPWILLSDSGDQDKLPVKTPTGQKNTAEVLLISAPTASCGAFILAAGGTLWASALALQESTPQGWFGATIVTQFALPDRPQGTGERLITDGMHSVGTGKQYSAGVLMAYMQPLGGPGEVTVPLCPTPNPRGVLCSLLEGSGWSINSFAEAGSGGIPKKRTHTVIPD